MLKRILSIAVLGLCFLPHVVLAESLVERLSLCAQTKDSLVRLLCYDKVAKNDSSTNKSVEKVESKKTVVKSPAVIGKKLLPAVVNKAENKADTFGKEHLVKEKSDEESFDKVTFTVLSVKKDIRKNLQIVFENGQVWKQTGDKTLKLRAMDRVKISKGMLGSFYLSKVKQNKTIKVKRIK